MKIAMVKIQDAKQ